MTTPVYPKRTDAAGGERGGVGLVALAWALWSLDPIVVCRIGSGVPRGLLVGLTALLAGLMFAPHLVRAARRGALLARRHRLLLAAQAVLFTAVCQVCYVAALRLLHPGVVSAVLRTQMAAAVLLAVALLGERMNRWSAAGILLIALANAGLLVGALRSGAAARASTAGWALALAAALLSSGGTVTGKALLEVFRPVELTAVRLAVAGALMTAVSLWQTGLGPMLALTPLQWGLLALKGVVTTGCAFLCYNAGLRRMPVYLASALEPFAPLFTFLAAYAFLGQTVTAGQAGNVAVLLFGGALVLVGYWMRRDAARREA